MLHGAGHVISVILLAAPPPPTHNAEAALLGESAYRAAKNHASRRGQGGSVVLKHRHAQYARMTRAQRSKMASAWASIIVRATARWRDAGLPILRMVRRMLTMMLYEAILRGRRIVTMNARELRHGRLRKRLWPCLENDALSGAIEEFCKLKSEERCHDENICLVCEVAEGLRHLYLHFY